MIYPWRASAKPAGGGGYTAPAVHFDGATSLSIASLSATDAPTFGACFWIKAAAPIRGIIFVGDPLGQYDNFAFFVAASLFRFGFQQYNDSPLVEARKTSFPADAWHCVVLAADTDHAAPDKICKIYMDRVDVGSIQADVGAAFTPTFNGLSFYVGDDTYGDTLTADIADLRIAPGQNWLTAGAVSSATLDLFQDAVTLKPVSPAVATASLGAPCILFSGSASTFGTNQGSGGAFTTTGALTNASTSPSD